MASGGGRRRRKTQIKLGRPFKFKTLLLYRKVIKVIFLKIPKGKALLGKQTRTNIKFDSNTVSF